MDTRPMKILIIEDEESEYSKFIECEKQRNDIKIVAITDSNIEAIKHIKNKHPDGIVLDIELNKSKSESIDSIDFLDNLKKLKLSYEPIIIVTTHINSNKIYDILHKNGVDLILYKDNRNYSANHVFNRFISLRKRDGRIIKNSTQEDIKSEKERISECIDNELDLIGITSNLKGRKYIHDAIMYLIENEENDGSVIQYLTKIHKKADSTINTGIKNAIIHGWRVSAIEDLEKNYTANINHNTGIPTSMELIYYYRDKIKKLI